MFSTDYIWESKDQSETIKNLDDLTDQVNNSKQEFIFFYSLLVKHEIDWK
jgi:hypothetical protein